MIKEVVARTGISTRLACEMFQVSETCDHYAAERTIKDEEIADWLMRLNDNHLNWGFRLCFPYLRNVKGFGRNQKRV